MAKGRSSNMLLADLERHKPVEIKEEEISETKKSSLCENCVKERRSVRKLRFEPERWFVERVAVFLCSECEIYVCINCLPRHESHKGMRVGREESEREKEREISESERMEEESEREISLLLDDLMKECKTERIEKFDKSHVSIYDRVYVQHKLDWGDCWITGLCGLENQTWVACDYHNSCIKIFTSGSNVLQRYIRFVRSSPLDVTEILVNQNSTEPNLASGKSSGISVTDRAEQKKQCLIAVTFSVQIVFIDLSKKPAFIHKIIRTEGIICRSIQFYEGKIFTACREGPYDYFWSVYIYSTDGDKLNKFNTGIYRHFRGPYLAVVSGRVYLIDEDNNKVQCRNVEGQFLSEITIKGSVPVGTSVDPDKNVYVCAQGHGEVYKLDADLTGYESVLDQNADYIEEPEALSYHRDKLFISHVHMSSTQNFVTVVRLL